MNTQLAYLPALMASQKRKSDLASSGEHHEKKQKLSTTHRRSTPKEDIPFPRGGASVLTPLEQRQISIQAKNDVLFEQRTGRKAPRQDFADEEDASSHDDEPAKAISSRPKKKKTTKAAAAADTAKSRIRIQSLSYKVCPFSYPEEA